MADLSTRIAADEALQQFVSDVGMDVKTLDLEELKTKAFSGQDLTMEEVKAHNSPGDCWVVIGCFVYDVTKFLHEHPGGDRTISDRAGRDVSKDFKTVLHSNRAKEIRNEYRIGYLPTATHLYKLLSDDKYFYVHELFRIGVIKFGRFTLKSGIESPFYIDLRMLVSFPSLLVLTAKLMKDLVQNVEFETICGVPYTALPIASVMSTMSPHVPMVMRRKEPKKYGTKQTIEGVFNDGDRCLIVEDIVTSGMSVFETIKDLNTVGLKTQDIVVCVDREQGGEDNIVAGNHTLHKILTISSILEMLLESKSLEASKAEEVRKFIADNQVPLSVATSTTSSSDVKNSNSEHDSKQTSAELKELSFKERADLSKNASGRRLLNLMAEKKTNLSFSVDVTDPTQFLELVDQVGPFICLLKTHIDILEGFEQSIITSLQELAKKHNFMIFEDRKFADIGNTVKAQYGKGVYSIADWSDITNAHIVPGPGIIEGLKQVGFAKDRGLLLLAEMSSKGNMATAAYTEKAIELAQENDDFVMGFISMRRLTDNPAMIHMTPGVKLVAGTDNLGQQYKTPTSVITENKSDIIIVGRGIYGADDPAKAAEEYRQAAWDAYQARL